MLYYLYKMYKKEIYNLALTKNGQGYFFTHSTIYS